MEILVLMAADVGLLSSLSSCYSHAAVAAIAMTVVVPPASGNQARSNISSKNTIHPKYKEGAMRLNVIAPSFLL